MKTGNIYRLLRGAAVGAVVLFAASCVKEPLTNGGDPLPPVPDGKVRLELVTNADDFRQPVTRTGSASEEEVGNAPWVFVFKDVGDKKFVEAVQAVPLGETSYVTLTATDEARKLLILANTPAQFWNGSANVAFDETNVTAWLAGKTSTLAQQMLTTALGDPQMTVPYASATAPFPLLPMSGTVLLTDGIDAATTIGSESNKVTLSRIVAKVTVQNNVSTGFVLNGATVTEASCQSYLFPRETGVDVTSGTTTYLAATMSGEVTGIAKADQVGDAVAMSEDVGYQNTLSNPIYIYESTAGTTSVIIEGTYNNTTCYYKLAFKNKGAAEMDVERNKWYKFTITSVTGPGFETVGEAIAAPPSNNIIAPVEVTDLSSHDIVDNGQYYLGVSNSEFIVYDIPISGTPAVLSNIAAVTVTTNATSAMDITTNSITVSGTGLTLVSPVPPASLTLNGSTTINVSLAATFTSAINGTITIKLGNLTKTIKVTRKAALTYATSTTEFEGDYVAGKIESQGDGCDGWLSLSTENGGTLSSEVTRTDGQGSIYLMSKISAASRYVGGIVYLSRQNESGRVKLYVEQTFLWGGHADILYFDPTDDYRLKIGRWNDQITAANYRQRMAFTKFGSVVGFTIEGTTWSNTYIKFNPSDYKIGSTADGSTITGYAPGTDDQATGNALPYIPGFVSGDFDYNYGPNISSTDYHNYDNIKKGRGDICQLVGLTAAQIKGAATQADLDALLAARGADYKGWRLPTARENASFVGGASSYTYWISWKNGSTSYSYSSTTTADPGTTGNTVWPYYYDNTGALSTSSNAGVAGNPATGRFPVVTDAYNNEYTQILPATGCRDSQNGSVAAPGTHGLYWSSTAAVGGQYSYYLYFYSTPVMPVYDGSYSVGRSIRCVRPE